MPQEQINPIYAGDPREFHWVGFGSGSGTNLRECARVVKPVLIFSDKPNAKLFGLEELANVHHASLDGYEYCGSWKKAQGNPESEAEYEQRSIGYNRMIVDQLLQFQEDNGITIDLIVLGGYMRLLKNPLLDAFKDKIINVHPADLSILDRDGKRVYVGEDAVYDALKKGESRTRSSVIMVDNGVDHGEILTVGPEVEAWRTLAKYRFFNDEVALRKYADMHQEVQKRLSDWPALTYALKDIMHGRIALGTEKRIHDEWREVYEDGEPTFGKGVRLGV